MRIAYNIKWDVDYYEDDKGNEINLPQKVTIPNSVDDEDICDWLSDQYGFCHDGYEVEYKMDLPRANELLERIIVHIEAGGSNFHDIISELTRMGFERRDLLCYGFTEKQLDDWEAE